MSRTSNVFKRGASYSIRYRAKDPATGVIRQRMKGGFPSHKAAADALQEIKGSIKAGTYAAPAKQTLADFLENEWIPSLDAAVAGGSLKASAAAYYKDQVRWRIIPRIGGVQLSAVSAPMLVKLYGELLTSGRIRGEGGLAPATVHGTHVTLSRALGAAARWRKIAHNPARDVGEDAPTAANPKQEVWSPDQVQTFLAKAKSDRLSALWHLALFTGMRRGELAGLTREALDLDAGTLRVRSNRVVINYEVVEGTPKTPKSNRIIGLDAGTVAALLAHLERQGFEESMAGEAWKGEGYVFTDELGRPLHPTRMTLLFQRAAETAGLPVIKLHAARHSYATAGLEAGVALKVVSERLGHSSLAITADVYSHVSQATDQAAADRIAEHLYGSQ